MSTTTASVSPNQLYLSVNNAQVFGWQQISVARGIERCPSTFELLLTERNPQNAKIVDIVPGMPCQINIGSDILLVGYVVTAVREISADKHVVHVNGASKCVDLVDADGIFSAEPGTPATAKNFLNVLEMATDICLPFGITVTSKATSYITVPLYYINRGETAYQIIETFSRYSGLLVYDGTDGNLILSPVGTDTHTGVISQSPNTQDAASELTVQERFTEYDVFYSTSDTYNNPLQANQLHGSATDPNWPVRADGKPRYRPKFIVSDQSFYGTDAANFLANYYANRLAGRSQKVAITVSGWRDKAGLLWEPNRLVALDLPILKLTNVFWILSSVNFTLSEEGGQMSQLEFMPPSAFEVNTVPSWVIAPDVLKAEQSVAKPPNAVDTKGTTDLSIG